MGHVFARPFLVACYFALLGAGNLLAGTPHSGVPIGQSIENLHFKDVWLLPRSLDDLPNAHLYVIAVMSIEDTIARAYLPELKRLDELYRERGVQFLSINVDPRDTIREVADSNLDVEAQYPHVKDFTGTTAQQLGVTTFGEVVVLDGQRRIRYRGRIDDRFSQPRSDGGAIPEPQQRDLVRAIEDLLADREVARAETEALGGQIPQADRSDSASEPTFAHDIAPLVAKNCRHCHRPGTEAPFALETYDDVVTHAEMIAEVVLEQRMPPWFASRGKFANTADLTAEQRTLIGNWVSVGCPPGDLSKLEPVATDEQPSSEWKIGEPDLVIRVPITFHVPAEGFVPYRYTYLPHLFQHDTWFQAFEIRTDNPRVLHHCNVYYVSNLNLLKADAVKFVFGRVPGSQPLILDNHVGMRIPKRNILGVQVHLTTNGQPEDCNIEVGFRFPREVIHKEYHNLWMINDTFAIPPGASYHRVTAENTLDCDAIGAAVFPHMHLRGRDMTFVAHDPDGRAETLLAVPNYSFDWQMIYQLPNGAKRFPKGTRIECVAHYDNSPFNPYNPDPRVTVREGDQTTEEMLNGILFYLDEHEHLDLHVDPKTGEPQDKPSDG